MNLHTSLLNYTSAYAEHCRAMKLCEQARRRSTDLQARGIADELADFLSGVVLAEYRAQRAKKRLDLVQFGCFAGMSLQEAQWSAPDD